MTLFFDDLINLNMFMMTHWTDTFFGCPMNWHKFMVALWPGTSLWGPSELTQIVGDPLNWLKFLLTHWTDISLWSLTEQTNVYVDPLNWHKFLVAQQLTKRQSPIQEETSPCIVKRKLESFGNETKTGPSNCSLTCSRWSSQNKIMQQQSKCDHPSPLMNACIDKN